MRNPDFMGADNLNNLISVIVPVFNVEKYLSECVYSILKQTYKDFELILVDDGSTDNSGKICDHFCGEDKRIRVLHKKNGGLSSARNAGIDMANGSYLAFIDSDDYVEKNFLECLYDKLVEETADISECSYKRLIKGKLTYERLFKYDVLDNETAVRRLFAPPYQSFVVVWNKLYKKELFKKIRFPEGKLHEDELSSYKLIYESKKVAFVNKYLYIYRIRDDSIMTRGYSDKTAELLNVIEEQKEHFDKFNVDLDAELNYYAFRMKIMILNMMVDSKKYNDTLWNDIKEKIRSDKKEILHGEFSRIRDVLYIAVLIAGKKPYICFRRCTGQCERILKKLRKAKKYDT